MRIVLDTKSKSWANFKSILLGVVILFCIAIIGKSITRFTEHDVDFVTGVLCAVHSLRYKWTV